MSALVSPEQLLAELELRDPPLLIDVRWTLAGSDREGYLAGHLPGAVFCDLDADLADPPGAGGRHPLPSRDRLSESLRRIGVTPGTRVVVYDGGVAAAAARAWWCLRWVGHDDVRVLDGGLPAWVAADGELDTGEVAPRPQHAPSSPEPRAGPPAPELGRGPSSPEPRVTPASASSHEPAPSSPGASRATGTMATTTAEEIRTGQVGVLLDARAPERFRGEVEPVDPVAGHIPGARSLPTASLLDEHGRYLPTPRLRELLTAAGASGAEPVAAYCGSGVTAAQLVLAAHEVGIDVGLYPGSWSHWITDPGRPVATGPA